MPPTRFACLADANTPTDFREALAALGLQTIEALPIGERALEARLGRDARSVLAKLMERFSVALALGDRGRSYGERLRRETMAVVEHMSPPCRGEGTCALCQVASEVEEARLHR